MVLGAAGSRLVFSALLTVVAAYSLPSEAAAYVLQALLIQSGLIAFMSASSFARASYVASLRAEELRAAASGHLFFLMLSTLLAVPLMVLLVPSRGVGVGEHAFVAAALALGAATTAINSFLQGFVAVEAGRAVAFRPTLIASLVGVAMLPLVFLSPSPLTCALVWSGVQVVTPVVLLILNNDARWLAASVGTARSRGRGYVGVALIGGVNAMYVVSLVVFREVWAAGQAASTVEASYTAARLFELAMQVAFMFLASSPLLVASVFAKIQRAPALLMAGALLIVVLGGAPWAFAVWSDGEPSVFGFLFAESLTTPVRLASAACLVVLLHRTATIPYTLVVAINAAVPLGLLMVDSLTQDPFALQMVQAAIASTCVLVTLFVFHRWRVKPPVSEEHVGVV